MKKYLILSGLILAIFSFGSGIIASPCKPGYANAPYGSVDSCECNGVCNSTCSFVASVVSNCGVINENMVIGPHTNVVGINTLAPYTFISINLFLYKLNFNYGGAVFMSPSFSHIGGNNIKYFTADRGFTDCDGGRSLLTLCRNERMTPPIGREWNNRNHFFCTADYPTPIEYTGASTASCIPPQQHIVTFDGNGGGGHSPGTKNVIHNTAVGTLPSNPTRSGYTFGGWYTASSGGTAINSSTVVTNNVTWYAKRNCPSGYSYNGVSCVLSGRHFCANEGYVCSFNGTKTIRYGANGGYSYRVATNSISCSNSVFGDPKPYVYKQCHVYY